MMKPTILLFVALALATGGCGPGKPREVTRAARAEAAQNVSEAEFASQIRDYARAEGLLSHAVTLDTEQPQYWIQLGAARRHLNDLRGARKAYEQARDLLETAYKRDKTSPEALLIEIEVYVLLGKPAEARKVLARAQKAHPDDHNVRAFVENKVLEKMLENPELKAVGL